jgi:raffinose/stachyose/melibiose transport system permease protein
VFSFVGQYVSDYGLVFAGLVLAALPIIVIFLVLQRYVIRGFASGLKG